MAVVKRRLCTSRDCKKEFRDRVVYKKGNKESPPTCSCGAPTRYLPNWYVIVYIPVPGSKARKRRLKPFPTKAEAEAYEGEIKSQKAKGEVFGVTKDTSFASCAEAFIKWVNKMEADNQLAPGTARMYRDKTNTYLTPFFGKLNALQVTDDDIDRYIDRRRETPYYTKIDRKTGEVISRKFPTNSTMNKEIATLKRMYSVCKEKKILKYDPVEDYKLFTETERERYLLEDEIEQLLLWCKTPHLRLAVVVALNTGLRVHGVLTLRWDEIDWRNNEIVKVVKHHRSKAPRPVRIPMTDELKAELKARKKEVVDSAYVFPAIRTHDSDGNPRGDVHIRPDADIGFQTACKNAGIEDFRFHDLRHTFCTNFLEQNPDKIQILSEMVGHSSRDMTRRYAHVTNRARHQAMKNFSITKLTPTPTKGL
jgi:integrase